MTGIIHSTESFGSVDGPGIRFVVFLKGCPMRCKYCHNPDTWDMQGGEKMSTDNIIAAYNKNREFYRNGGITVTGGEPLVQIEFVTELFRKCHEEDIHTCLDTSGVTFDPDNTGKIDELLEYTDLVMLDIKHIDPELHKELTGHTNENILKFAEYMDRKGTAMWIRHVAVPGITDDEKYLFRLGEFIGTLRNVHALDVLAYHTMGAEKYRKLGIDYPLEGTEPMDKERAMECKDIILRGMAETRDKQ